MIKKIEVERFSLTTSKPFDEVIAGVNAAIGHPDMAEFGRSTHEARSFAELKSAVEKGLSTVGLMLFMQLDHGAILRKETGRETRRWFPLHYGQSPHHEGKWPSTFLTPVPMRRLRRSCGWVKPMACILSYDRMASFLAPYENRDALEVARDLDRKIEDLLRAAAV